MFHYNEGWREGSLPERMMPEMYLSPTIMQFYKIRQEVQSTSLLKAFLNANLRLYGKTLIDFHNVRYRRIARDIVQLEDITMDLQIEVDNQILLDQAEQCQKIINGDKVQLVRIAYCKANDRGHLFDIQKSLDIKFPQLAPLALSPNTV